VCVEPRNKSVSVKGVLVRRIEKQARGGYKSADLWGPATGLGGKRGEAGGGIELALHPQRAIGRVVGWGNCHGKLMYSEYQ